MSGMPESPENCAANVLPDGQVAVTLKLEPQVYDFFLQKAGKSGLEIETYLNKTLSIVLGCRAFNAKGFSVCSGDEGVAPDS